MASSLAIRLRNELARAGVNVARITPMSHAGSAAAFRIDLADGGSVKARVFASESGAAQVWRFLSVADHGVLPIPMHCVGRTVLVEFVDGTPLAHSNDANGVVVVRRAGALLARLHATPLSTRDRARAIRPSPDFLTRVMTALARRRLIDRETRTRVSALTAPRTFRLALTHGDFCPENLVLGLRGQLRAIDEERLAVRPAAFDLARAVTRWPLSAPLERRFLEGYTRAGGQATEFVADRTFWVATALAVSADYRIRRRLPGVRRVAAALRAISRDDADRSDAE